VRPARTFFSPARPNEERAGVKEPESARRPPEKFSFACPARANRPHFPRMGAPAKPTSKTAGLSGGFVWLAVVAAADFVTGYQLTFFIFYLLPILYVQRRAGQGFAFAMAVLSAVVWLYVDIASGNHYSDFLTPVWNTGIRLSAFLLVVVLVSARDELQSLVRRRTKNLEDEMRERSRLEKELLEIAEAEQRRIGQDLHDSLGQHLTATAMAGKLLAKKLAEKSPAEAAAANRVVALTEEAVELTRKLARSLHPVELEAGGLADALQQLAANISTAFNVSCRFASAGPLEVADAGTRTHLFRIAQEAASNAIRHGRARNIVISFEGLGERRLLAVTDDGVGLPADARKKSGMGLRIMACRARMIGATFDIENLPAGGARAVCALNPGQNFEDEN
jgi:signal transduction histidine kinase